MSFPTITSRYGATRVIVPLQDNWYRVSGPSRFFRAGAEPDSDVLAYFDFEGGPFISTRNELVCDNAKNAPFVLELKCSPTELSCDGIASVDVLLSEPLKIEEEQNSMATLNNDIDSVTAPIDGPVEKNRIYANSLPTLLTQLTAVNVAVGMYRALKATGQMTAEDQRIADNCAESAEVIKQVILEKFTRRP